MPSPLPPADRITPRCARAMLPCRFAAARRCAAAAAVYFFDAMAPPAASVFISRLSRLPLIFAAAAIDTMPADCRVTRRAPAPRVLLLRGSAATLHCAAAYARTCLCYAATRRPLMRANSPTPRHYMLLFRCAPRRFASARRELRCQRDAARRRCALRVYDAEGGACLLPDAAADTLV